MIESSSLPKMVPQTQIRREARRDERGYILLTLLLMMALLAIAATAIVSTIKFQVQRDREEEMIHRGVQYSRAIRAYYKKFGRYPVKLEDLETTNNLKFLRKRYKDPVNCKDGKCEDFKLLHFGEVKMFGSAGIAGATNVADMNNPSAGGLGNSSLGQSSLGQSSLGQSSSFGGGGSFGQSSLGGSSPGGSGGFGGSSSSGFGSSSFGSQSQQTGTSSGTNSSQNGQSGSNASGSDSNSSSNGGSTNGQVIGGGPIVGVVSNAKCPPQPKDRCEGYREFNHKKKYNDWQFVYDPGTDRGGLLMTPNQPPIQGVAQNPNQPNGTNGMNTNQSGGFGTIGGTNNGFSNSFGNSPGSQNNPNPSGGFGTPNPPNNPPQQQQ
jgi:type II secretory pathway pseudopilin PulG